jgi:hypothetical protein
VRHNGHMKTAVQPAAIGALTVIGLGLAFTLVTLYPGLELPSVTVCWAILIGSLVAAYAGTAAIVLSTSDCRAKAAS